MKDGYTTVNWNDANDGISIGKLQWHANNARDLLKEIRKENQSNFDKLASGTSLVKDLSESWNCWKNYTSYCPAGKALVSILGTEESKKIQDEMAVKRVQGYIDKIKGYGITDPEMIAYIADIWNQSPECGGMVASRAVKNGIKNLDELHKAVCDCSLVKYGDINIAGHYSKEAAINRRNKTYNSIKEASKAGKFTENNLTNMPGKSGTGIIGWPCPGVTYISSHFYRDNGAYHGGIDIAPDHAGKQDRTIIAPIDGICVSTAQYGDSYGYDKLDDGVCGYGYYQYIVAEEKINGVWYGCLMAHQVKLGSINGKVKRGDVIGKIGNTGNSSGAHCHF